MEKTSYDEDNLINQYARSLFENIEKEVSLNFEKNEDFSIHNKKINNKLLILNIRFKSNSPNNRLSQDIYFAIEINEKYPETKPVMKCLSNVSHFI